MEYKLIPYQESEWLILSNEDIDDQESHYSSKYGGEIHSHKHRNNEETCSNIIACTKKIDKSIPLIRKEQLIFPEIAIDEAINYAEQEYTSCDEYNFLEFNAAINGFEKGYLKHAKTHPFTLDDMIKAYKIGESNGKGEKDFIRFDETIVSLQQLKKEYIVKIEMIQRTILGEDPIFYTEIKIDKEGYINIVNIKAL